MGNGILLTRTRRVLVDKLQPVRCVEVVSDNVENALCHFIIITMRCGQISRKSRREFRVAAFLSKPQPVVAVFVAQ